MLVLMTFIGIWVAPIFTLACVLWHYDHPILALIALVVSLASETKNYQIKQIDMPTYEYRVIVNGNVLNKNYTKKEHNELVDLYNYFGIEFTEEIVEIKY